MLDYFSQNKQKQETLRGETNGFLLMKELSKKPFELNIPFHKDIIINVTDLPEHNFLPHLCLETLKLKKVIS